MNYKFDDILKVAIGDTVTMEDGRKHEAVSDMDSDMPCFDCSLRTECSLYQWDYNSIQCSKERPYHFNLLRR